MPERLRQRDLTALQRCVVELYALGDLSDFQRRVVQAVSSLIPCDVTAYSEIDLRLRTLSWDAQAARRLAIPDATRIYSTHMAELPLFKTYTRGEGSAWRISDFLSQREFRRTALYNEFYRPLGLEYHIVKGLPGPPALVTSVTTVRGRKDFTERDRQVLNLLGPHLNQSYRNAQAVSRMGTALTALDEALDTLGHGVAIVTRDGRVTRITRRARAWITDYFGALRGERLPDDLRRWLNARDQRLGTTAGSPAPCEPLVATCGTRHLTVRLVRNGDGRLLLMSERDSEPRPALLAPLGVSAREAEVLAWVAEGKTNAEIATILGMSARTVDKHLERILQKLGVETRTAAAARALSHLHG